MKRKTISKKMQIAILNRDHWHCRYCLNPVFFGPTLKLLHKISPGHSYYHPNGKQGQMIRLFFYRWASVDHVVPFSKGGPDSMDNFVTACWECNMKLNDKEHNQGKPKLNEIPPELIDLNWDGFSSIYPTLPKAESGWLKQLEGIK